MQSAAVVDAAPQARRRGLHVLSAAGLPLLVAGSLTGCGQFSSAAPRGLPERVTASPSTVALGGSVVLSAPPASCELGYETGRTCSFQWVLMGRGERKWLGTASVARDGSFTRTLQVPLDASPGEAAIMISGSPYDEPCDDTNGGAASCAIYDVSIVLAPPVASP